jgi:hypothetical protein
LEPALALARQLLDLDQLLAHRVHGAFDVALKLGQLAADPAERVVDEPQLLYDTIELGLPLRISLRLLRLGGLHLVLQEPYIVTSGETRPGRHEDDRDESHANPTSHFPAAFMLSPPAVISN